MQENVGTQEVIVFDLVDRKSKTAKIAKQNMNLIIKLI